MRYKILYKTICKPSRELYKKPSIISSLKSDMKSCIKPFKPLWHIASQAYPHHITSHYVNNHRKQHTPSVVFKLINEIN